MPPQHPAMSPSVAKKTRKSLTLEVKLDIINGHKRGEKTNNIARHHGLTSSTVSTIFKSADSIFLRRPNVHLPPWKVILSANHWLSSRWDHNTVFQCYPHALFEVRSDFWLNNQEAIGGPGVIVEIDETFIVRWKFERGQRQSDKIFYIIN
ncbi:hypothetical protein E2C01_055633 [Portunus trituberculatus]|uniref:HTH psq-type domain-containing protein n=1 Tax=Portunus trituberculatus TaxID=210409 RepID=A0A5B7GN00_PORTR|nr:hypothetical protein [Portunus trituberculatus]